MLRNNSSLTSAILTALAYLFAFFCIGQIHPAGRTLSEPGAWSSLSIVSQLPAAASSPAITRWAEVGSPAVARIAANRFSYHPLIKNVSRAQLDKWRNDPRRMECENFAQILDEVGINGAIQVLPLIKWHPLAQFIGSVTKRRSYDLPGTFALLAYIQSAHLPVFHTSNAFGIIHAAAWYYVATETKCFQWTDFLERVCPYFFPAALHGVGHGLMLRFSNAYLEGCSPLPVTTNSSALLDSAEICANAPFAVVSFYCAEGLYHNFMEYSDFPENRVQPSQPLSWLYPCRFSRLSAWCFTWIFGQGLNWKPGVGAWPTSPGLLALSQYRYDLPSLCLNTSMESNVNVRGCIWGMTASKFMFFHEGWIAMHNHQSPLEACLRVPFDLVLGSFSRIHCPLLFGNDSEQTKSYGSVVGSRRSLMAWCSLFVPKEMHRDMHREHWQRWMACLHSFAYHTGYKLEAWNVNLSAIQVLCKHDLVSQAGPTWKLMEEFCHKQLHFHVSTPFGSPSWKQPLYDPDQHSFVEHLLVDMLA